MATQQQTDEKARSNEKNEQGGQQPQQARGQGSQGQQSPGPQQSREGSRGSQPQGQQGANAMQRRQAGGGFAPFAVGPFALIRRMQEDLDRVFGGAARGQSLASRQAQGLGEWSPAIETFQRGNDFVVRADLPGLSADDVSVEVGEDEVVIAGERRYEHEEERDGVYVSELTYGGFTRVVPLPPGAIADNAKATFNDGVLEIVVPAPSQEARRGRRVEIQQGSK